MSATTFLRRRNYAGDTCKNEEFPAATFGKAFCIFRYLGVAKNSLGGVVKLSHFVFTSWLCYKIFSSVNSLFVCHK